jgi:pimeloyl-ACP methyl ester carboxylesterase
MQAVAELAGDAPFVVGISSGAGLALQAAASGVRMRKLALYEPPYADDSTRPVPLETAKAHLNDLIQANDRYGAVKYFMTDVFGAPKTFVFVMPLVMRDSWKRNELVAHTLPYDLTILEDESVLTSRSAQIVLPVLVVGGEDSPQPLRDSVARVAKALPHASSRLLPGQTHILSAAAFAPVVTEFLLQQSRACVANATSCSLSVANCSQRSNSSTTAST